MPPKKPKTEPKKNKSGCILNCKEIQHESKQIPLHVLRSQDFHTKSRVGLAVDSGSSGSCSGQPPPQRGWVETASYAS